MIGICHVPAAPVRYKPTHKAQMVTQLLAGEMIEVLDIDETWFLIMTQEDGVKGWVDSKMIVELLDGEDTTISRSWAGMIQAPLYCSKDQYGRTFWLPAGSNLYLHGSSVAVAPRRNLEKDVIEQLYKPTFHSRKNIITTALAFNGAPAMMGGKTIFGIDCSGLIQIVFALNGISLPRTLEQQVEIGQVVNLKKSQQPGDLAFFENTEGNIIHAGIIMDKDRIIHTYGEVRVDMIDAEGIYDKYTRQHTHRLRVVKNVIDR